jgi:hypothetical protein
MILEDGNKRPRGGLPPRGRLGRGPAMASNTTDGDRATARSFRAMADLMPGTMDHLRDRADQIDPPIANDSKGQETAPHDCGPECYISAGARSTPDADLEDAGYGPARYEVRVQIVRVVPDASGQFEDIQDSLTVADGPPTFSAANELAGRIAGAVNAWAIIDGDKEEAPGRHGGIYRRPSGPMAPYPRPRTCDRVDCPEGGRS